MRLPDGLTIDMITDAVENASPDGFCLNCAAEAYNVEPDARMYECEECGDTAVYGAEELLIMFAF